MAANDQILDALRGRCRPGACEARDRLSDSQLLVALPTGRTVACKVPRRVVIAAVDEQTRPRTVPGVAFERLRADLDALGLRDKVSCVLSIALHARTARLSDNTDQVICEPDDLVWVEVTRPGCLVSVQIAAGQLGLGAPDAAVVNAGPAHTVDL